MIKRKFSLYLNIASICLSICAIAIGVYSVKNASLNVNGSLGFTAHNCKVDIVTSMYGDSAESDSPDANSIASGVIRSEENAKTYDKTTIDGDTQNLNIGTLYFCDMTESGKVHPITLSFTMTNKSAFYIDVTVNQKCISDNRISIYAPNNGETIAPNENITLKVQFKLQIHSSIDNSIPLSNVNLLNFTKSQAPAYLATDWKDKITTAFSISNIYPTTKISYVKEINDTILNGFVKDGETYKSVSVGAINETSTAGDLTENVSDIKAYYKTNSNEIVIYSPARIYAPQNCGYMFSNYAITSLDVSNFDTSKVTNMGNMFRYCQLLTSLDVSNFDTSKVTNMGNMFRDCNKLTSLDVSNFDTSKVIDMQCMFESCEALTSLDVSNFDTSKVTNMFGMFAACGKLTSIDVTKFNTSNVTNMQAMFGECYMLTSLDLSNFNTSSVTNMSSMFAECDMLTSLNLSNFDTSKVTNMSSMFAECDMLTSLNLSNFDTSKVTNMGNMFRYCQLLTSLDVSNFDTSNVTDMNSMFHRSSSLTSLDLSNFNTSKVTNMFMMFTGCSKLKTIYVNSNKWSTTQVTNSNSMFDGCTNLPNFDETISDKTNAHTGSGGYLTEKA